MRSAGSINFFLNLLFFCCSVQSRTTREIRHDLIFLLFFYHSPNPLPSFSYFHFLDDWLMMTCSFFQEYKEFFLSFFVHKFLKYVIIIHHHPWISWNIRLENCSKTIWKMKNNETLSLFFCFHSQKKEEVVVLTATNWSCTNSMCFTHQSYKYFTHY